MPTPLRFGLIGCGHQGRYLCEALRCAGPHDLVACADPDEAARERAVAQFGFAHDYESPAKMLFDGGLDAAIVATTHDQLQPCAMAAILSGCHVFVEKPMALNAEHGQALADEANRTGHKLMVGYALRYRPDRVLMGRMLAEGVIGDLVQVHAGQLIGSMGGWLGKARHGGGPLLYVGCHALDQILWCNPSPVTRVYAEEVPSAVPGVEADALLTLRFADGCLATLSTSQRLGGRYGWLDLLGTHGRMRAEWESYRLSVESRKMAAYSHLTHLDVAMTDFVPALAPDATSTLASYYYVRMWAAEMVEFVSAIQEDRRPAISGEDGVRALRVMDAARQSAETGQAIALRET
ncbi:MAG: Gfo/Idh/MocA family oxidoreductase [Armatimonadetes bacterium]|nr:Gfo/Idh/MocA family oxidoreductase [Armatimonadota bacterium]